MSPVKDQLKYKYGEERKERERKEKREGREREKIKERKERNLHAVVIIITQPFWS